MMATVSPHHRQSIRLALLALAFLNAGAAVPFGISEISIGVESDPNASEYVLSALFAVMSLAALIGLFRYRRLLDEVAFYSGALWLIADSYIAVDSDIETKARLGLGLIFAGVALGCFALWQRLRAEADRIRGLGP